MILADTSAWVEFDRATGTWADDRMARLLDRPGSLAVCEPVTMEVLAEARDEHSADQLQRLLDRAILQPVAPTVDFATAVRLDRSARREGCTPRGPLDCLIVAIAWRTGASMLSLDPRIERPAALTGVTMDQASQ